MSSKKNLKIEIRII